MSICERAVWNFHIAWHLQTMSHMTATSSPRMTLEHWSLCHALRIASPFSIRVLRWQTSSHILPLSHLPFQFETSMANPDPTTIADIETYDYILRKLLLLLLPCSIVSLTTSQVYCANSTPFPPTTHPTESSSGPNHPFNPSSQLTSLPQSSHLPSSPTIPPTPHLSTQLFPPPVYYPLHPRSVHASYASTKRTNTTSPFPRTRALHAPRR